MAVEEPKDLQMTERHRALNNKDFFISPLFFPEMYVRVEEFEIGGLI